MQFYSVSLNENFKPGNAENNSKILKILTGAANMTDEAAESFLSSLSENKDLSLILHCGSTSVEEEFPKLGIDLKQKRGMTWRQLRAKLNSLDAEVLDERAVIYIDFEESGLTPEGVFLDTAYDIGADPIGAKKDFQGFGPYLEVYYYSN